MEVIGITGKSGSGKTTFTKKIIDMASKKNLHIEGFISPAVFKQGKKVAINVVNIASGEERSLAEINDNLLETNLIGQWKFNLDAIEWVENFTNQVGECDIFVADEIGPLEIVLGKGWSKIFGEVTRINPKTVIFSFRPKFIDYFVAKYPNIQIIDLSVTSSEDLSQRTLHNLIL
ncbi:MAG: nucleoside-triphosphatase [Anaerolineaceae bacterium]|nr:nucleoside-triphosphatase [Anaerolineaceae bacterium]